MAEEFNIFDVEAEFNIFDEPDIFDERTFGKRLERGAITIGEGFGRGVSEFVKLPVRGLKAAAEFLIPERITAGEETLVELGEEKQAVSEFFEREIAGVEQLAKRIGFIQEEFQPETAFERITVATGRELGIALFPLGAQFQAAKSFKRVLTESEGLVARLLRETAENPTLTALAETGLTATAGAGLGIAEEVAPDSPVAQVVGGLAGVLGPIGGLRALQKVRSGLTPNLAVRETPAQGVKSEDINIRFTQEEPITAKAAVEFGKISPAEEIGPVFPKSIQAGPFSAPITPLGKKGEFIFREMAPDGLDNILLAQRTGGQVGGFFANAPEFALGQGFNTGVKIKLKADFVSGEQSFDKPGLRIPGTPVKEFRANFIAADAIESIEIEAGQKLPPLIRRLIGNSGLDVKKLDDGSLILTPPAKKAAPPQRIPSPARVSIEFGKITEDLAGNINLNNFDTTDQAKQLMRETAAANAEFTTARRGEISLAETDAAARQLIADDIGIPVEKIGQAFNAEELTGLRIMLADSSENVVGLSRRVNAGDNSSETISELQTAMVRHSALQEQVSGATAEAGRALSALRITARTEKQRLEVLDELIRASGGRENIEELAAKIVTINDPAALNRFIKDSQKATFTDKALEIYINELLSGPQTHVTNIVSNAFFATYQIPERLLAGIISKAGTKEISLLEAPAQALGMIQGIKEGGLLAAKSFKTGAPAFGVGKIDLPRKKAIGGKVGEFVRLPGRALIAADDFFKGIGYRMELNALAVRQTTKELGPASPSNAGAFSRRFTEIVQNPTAKMIDKASEQATVQTFTIRLGPTGEKIAAIRNPAFRIVAPFIRTPTNIAKEALKRIPATAPFMQSFRADLKAGGAAREQALSRVALGSVLGGTVAAYATEGLITGAGPSDPEARRVWLEDHQPFSVRVGDEWIAYGRIEPFATIIGLAADLGSLGGEASPEELDDMATFLTVSIAKNLTNKTFLRGMTNAIEAINDPDRFGSEFITNFAATVATPSVIAQTARVTDPTLRETRPDETIDLGKTELLFQEILNKIKARTPGFSDTLPPKIGLWGEAIAFEGGLGPDFISPIYTRKWKNDFITQEVLRLDANPGFISREAFGTDLSPEEFKIMSQIAGQSARNVAESIVLSPTWDTLPDRAKKLVFGEIFKSSRALARAQILPQIAGRVKETRLKEAAEFVQ